MGLLDGLFGGSNQATTSTTKPPAFVTEASKRAVGLATDIADQPYTPYTGARVAPKHQNTALANRAARQGFAAPQDMITAGYDLAQQLGERSGWANAPGKSQITEAYRQAKQAGNRDWTSGAAKRYMNPFIQQALDPVIRRINEEAMQNAIGGRAGMIGAGGVGAFGDARTAVMEGEMEEARLRGVSDTLGTGYANAYDRALAEWGATGDRMLASAGQMGQQGAQLMSGWQQARDRQLRAADLMGTQGGRARATTSAGLADLAGTGAAEEARTQRSLDTAYGDFQEQRDWNQRGLDSYIRALQGVPFEQQNKASGNTGQSILQQGVGAAVTGAGLWNLFS